MQELAQILLGMIEDAHEHVGAVAHGHHGKARAVVVEHFALRGAQYGFGQHGRAGGEVVNRGIHSKNSIENVAGCLNGWGFYRLQTRCSKDFCHFPAKRHNSEKLFISYDYQPTKVTFTIYSLQTGSIAINSITASEAHPVAILVFAAWQERPGFHGYGVFR